MMTIGRSLSLAVAALVVSSSSTLAQQSLGVVARQEEARRKEVKTAAKVYTNESLQADSSGGASPAPAPVPAAQTPAAAVAPKVGEPAAAIKPNQGTQDANAAGARDEAYWKKRLADVRTSIDRSKTLAEALQSRINGLTADFSARSDPAQRNQIAADRQRALSELERVRKEIDEGSKSIISIQEEARKSGVPAGWVR